jgi:hypothetical protein
MRTNARPWRCQDAKKVKFVPEADPARNGNHVAIDKWRWLMENSAVGKEPSFRARLRKGWFTTRERNDDIFDWMDKQPRNQDRGELTANCANGKEAKIEQKQTK